MPPRSGSFPIMEKRHKWVPVLKGPAWARKAPSNVGTVSRPAMFPPAPEVDTLVDAKLRNPPEVLAELVALPGNVRTVLGVNGCTAVASTGGRLT